MGRSMCGRYGVPVCLVLAVLLSVGGVCAPARAASGPADSIRMLQKGIDTKDKALVTRYLDIDAVVDKAVETLLADGAIVREVAHDPAIAVLFALGGDAGAKEALRTVLRSETRGYVLHGVTSGAFAGTPDASAAAYRSLFGMVFRGGDKDRTRFGPAKVLKHERDMALVATTLHRGSKGKQYPLELQLEKQDAVWRIVALANAAEILRQEKSEETQ